MVLLCWAINLPTMIASMKAHINACSYLILDCVCICIPSAGAMRLPCRPKDPNKTHFLSDFYIQKFQLPVIDFVNQNTNGFLKFYNMPKVRMCGKAYLCDCLQLRVQTSLALHIAILIMSKV